VAFALALPDSPVSDHMGAIFEGIWEQEVLGQPARTVGRIWAAEYDLDVAAKLLDGSSVYGECKWWKDPVGENVLERLLETCGQTKYGTRTAQTQYVLFSRSGFTAALKACARKDEQLHLIGPAHLLKP
jgi:uncharacterized protein